MYTEVSSLSAVISYFMGKSVEIYRLYHKHGYMVDGFYFSEIEILDEKLLVGKCRQIRWFMKGNGPVWC